jgi:hypothetical protein
MRCCVRAPRAFDQRALFVAIVLKTNSPHTGFITTLSNRSFTSLLFSLGAWIFASAVAFSQLSTKVGSVTPSSASPKVPLTIRVSLQQGETIEKIFLVYRTFGSSEYNRLEMEIVGNTASVTLPAQDVLPPFIEYYVVLVNRNGTLESYPLSETYDPFETPPGKTLQISIAVEAETDAQIVFLSPDPGTRISAEDLVISVSLLRADSLVVRRATQILLDGADISEGSVISDDILVVAPENTGIAIRPGAHRLTVRLFNREGTLHRSASLTFTVLSGGISVAEPTTDWRYNATIQLESRHEDVISVGTWYNRGNITFGGTIDEWRFNANVFITSDEKTDRQPQDRYFASAELPWVRVGYGDAYPSLPSLVLSGKRVRGLVSALRLGWFNLDLTLGKTTRPIDGSLLATFNADSFAVEYRRDSLAGQIPPYGRINSQTWGKFSYGTYARNLFAIRPSFGSGEHWQFGLTWLKSKDDIGSINYGTRPQENFVLGTDFVARFDEKRIELAGQGAFSAFNSDISSGNFTDAYIDSVYAKDADKIKRTRDILQNVITVNDNLRPLNLGKLATVAYDVALSLNYFANAFKLTYLFRGSDYNSFGQTFLRKDIKGINVTDRVRFAENRVLATASAEFLKDNTSDSKIATTSFSNLNFAVSYFPGPEYPNATVGFGHYASENGISLSDSLIANSAINDATNRFFVQSTYEFDLSARHTASFNLSTSNRDDRSLRQHNVKNITVAFGLSTKYVVPLQTSVNFSFNANSLPKAATLDSSGRFNYSTLSLSARYSFAQDLLIFTGTASPTFGDFTRTVWDASLGWNAIRAMIFELQFSLYNNHGFSNDTIWSLRYRYDI